jgi:hypothetical protein
MSPTSSELKSKRSKITSMKQATSKSRRYIPLEMSFDYRRITRLCTPEDGNLHKHRCDSIKSCNLKSSYSKAKSKAIPVTGRGGLHGCEMLRVCLDQWYSVFFVRVPQISFPFNFVHLKLLVYN